MKWQEAEVLDVGHAVLDAGKGPAIEEVGGVHRVAGLPQDVGEGMETLGLAHRVVEQQYLCHVGSLVVRSVRASLEA